MVKFLVRRLLLAIPTVLALSALTFISIQLPPGDFATNYLESILRPSASHGSAATAFDPAMEEAIRKEFGLDQPQVVQYAKWMWRMVHLDLGISVGYGTRTPITEVIGDKLVNTVIIAIGTILFTWVLAIPIGIYSAVRHNTLGDHTVTFIGFLGLAIPDFLLALSLMWLGFVWFDWDIGGLYSTKYLGAAWSWGKFVDMLKHIWIPALVLGTAGTAGLIRVLRNNLLDELNKPYVVAARARGLSEWKLVLKYPVRLALNPFISTIGYLLPFMLSGSIIVSIVLSLPTVGPILLESLLAEDLFLSSAILLALGLLTVLGTLISDILLVILDPRIRFEN